MNTCSSNKQLRHEKVVLDGTLVKTKNKLGQEIATKAVLQGDIKDLKRINDSTYKELQQIRKEYKKNLKSATYLVISTKDTVSSVTIVAAKDTVQIDSLVYIYPSYKAKMEIKNFATYEMYMDKDSSNLITDIRNPIDIVQYDKRPAPFKRKQLYVDVKTLNPNSGTEQVTSFHVKEKKRRTGLKVVIGIAAFETLRLLLTK